MKSVKRVQIQRFGADGGTCNDAVAMEEPLEIRLAWAQPDGRREQKSISITMRTPGNDEELAAGFLLTEGIIAGPAEIEAAGPCGPPAANGLINVVRVDLAPGVKVDLARLERHFYTSSSCGVCGKASLDAVAVQGRYDLRDNPLRISAENLGALPDRLRASQSVFERTGGLHASGLFDAAGQVQASREDVGRHNALDKLIGQALLAGELPMSGYGAVLSGRASFELMQKAMMAGIPLVAAVGAPSSLAVEFADEFGMTLAGFVTAGRFNVYSRPDRIA
ncbi:MAG: formate dehydrogenase accessory sulfurtransferase FdhD [Gammaproteobacteria bacterium]|nr:formate dehydrogenase accessory sulfurtransferase FdhD [Gammaproteobacteria bacterium]MYD02651.1 formate dehydrogenase accessory sulfurtransferase FdhD [Gammaproteobacteria bacterium]MYE48956.1 formate dehydrogenase accessory sulfurtransferase FdhD [Gammaproteobacteria bacterium]MYI24121.1 formate dehydrogenase accessory sulfurtransferase FdhD [Gammaproteobacteria bacterium]